MILRRNNINAHGIYYQIDYYLKLITFSFPIFYVQVSITQRIHKIYYEEHTALFGNLIGQYYLRTE